MQKKLVFVVLFFLCAGHIFAMNRKRGREGRRRKRHASNFILERQVFEFFNWVDKKENAGAVSRISQLLDCDLKHAERSKESLTNIFNSFLNKQEIERDAEVIEQLLPDTMKKIIWHL